MTKDEFNSKFTSCYEKYMKQFSDSKEVSKRLNLPDNEVLSTTEIIAKLFYLNLEINTKFLYETLSDVLDLDD